MFDHVQAIGFTVLGVSTDLAVEGTKSSTLVYQDSTTKLSVVDTKADKVAVANSTVEHIIIKDDNE